MMPARRTVTTLCVALTAAFAAAVPATAATGVGGYVTDADTGLGLGGATVAWNSTMSPPPQATSDPTGRYLFAGLDPGSTGTLSVAGPAGWDRRDVPNVTVPDGSVASEMLALHRDWAATAGGAHATGNDDSVAGCPSALAVDGDRATGWSASATRPAADPPTLTVELPQSIEVDTLVLDPTSTCGHDAGAALGRYRVETSPDGASWATAAEGTLGASDRGTAVEIAPSGNAADVRFVRLVALGAQDPAAATIDVRELKVFGVTPNVAPSGTLTTDTPRVYVNGPVGLRAAFTDPDSTILRYLWDFDGDGTWDQATFGPTVYHVWAGAGTYHVVVGARDFRGALGTSSIELRVTDPNQPVEPIIQRKPLITFDAVDGIDLDTRIACSSKCRFTAKMVISARMARRLHTKRRTIFTFARSTEGPGLGSWTLELPQKTIKLLRRAHVTKLKVRLTTTATDQQGRRTKDERWITFS
jgi:hypothetical protein